MWVASHHGFHTKAFSVAIVWAWHCDRKKIANILFRRNFENSHYMVAILEIMLSIDTLYSLPPGTATPHATPPQRGAPTPSRGGQEVSAVNSSLCSPYDSPEPSALMKLSFRHCRERGMQVTFGSSHKVNFALHHR